MSILPIFINVYSHTTAQNALRIHSRTWRTRQRRRSTFRQPQMTNNLGCKPESLIWPHVFDCVCSVDSEVILLVGKKKKSSVNFKQRNRSTWQAVASVDTFESCHDTLSHRTKAKRWKADIILRCAVYLKISGVLITSDGIIDSVDTNVVLIYWHSHELRQNID